MPSGRLRLFQAYVAAISVAGVAAALALPGLFGAYGPADFGLRWLLLTAAVIAGELYPLRVPRGDAEGEVTLSTAFAFAILLDLGTFPAVVALILAAVCADLFGRKPAWKVVFNAAQYTVSAVAAGAAFSLLSGVQVFAAPPTLGTSQLPAALAAAAVFFAVNLAVMAALIALGSTASKIEPLGVDFTFHAMAAGVALSLSPIVVVAVEQSLWLLPLLLVPMIASYKSVSIYLEREHQALHDVLTGLPNRALFEDRAQQAVSASGGDGRRCAVLMVDLDRFKDVNDVLGYSTGDLLLQEMGRRLKASKAATDTVARLGGDEFGLLVSDVPDAAAAKVLADNLRKVVEQPVALGNVSVSVEASVGIALHPEHAGNAEALVARADMAMHVAKQARSGLELYDPARHRDGTDRVTLLARLRGALDDDHIELHYQPKASLPSGTISSVEGLVRWNDPREGLIMPDRFITLAEQTGLMRAVTHRVLDLAIQQARQWRDAGMPQRTAVNISARDVQDATLPDEVQALLQRWGVSAELLELEITEHTLMDSPQRAAQVMRRLHDLGVTLTIDDFGTGNTSLALLRRLPVDSLKIDREFVMDMTSREGDDVIVRTTIDLGHNLGLKVVAEGVENDDAWQRLAALGCDAVQGYHLSRPKPSADLEALLRSHSA